MFSHLLCYFSVLSEFTLWFLKDPIKYSIMYSMLRKEFISSTVKFSDKISKDLFTIFVENPLPKLFINSIDLLKMKLLKLLIKIFEQYDVKF